MPGADDTESDGPNMNDGAFEAMLENSDPDAFEAEQEAPDSGVEPPPHEPERPEDEPELAPLDEEVGEDIEPLAPEARMRRDLRAEATSLRHLLTHLPKNPYCVHCQQAKTLQRYSHKGAFKREIDQFGEIVTCDHVVAPAMRMQGLGGEKYGLSVRNLFTGMIAIYPTTTHDTEATTTALKQFAGRKKIHNIYSDNALELVKAAYVMSVEHRIMHHSLENPRPTP